MIVNTCFELILGLLKKNIFKIYFFSKRYLMEAQRRLVNIQVKKKYREIYKYCK